MLKKCFELISKDWNSVILLPLILLPLKVDAVTKKQSIKRYVVRAFAFSNGKVAFTLLIKVVAFHIRLTIICV